MWVYRIVKRWYKKNRLYIDKQNIFVKNNRIKEGM